jgi:hypothetical protein
MREAGERHVNGTEPVRAGHPAGRQAAARRRSAWTRCWALALLLAGAAQARQGEPPYSLTQPAKARAAVPLEEVAGVDAAQRRAEADAAAHAPGPQRKRLAVADGRSVSITSEDAGRWQTLPDGSRLWQVQVRAAGATDLRLGFSQYALAPGATLHVIGAGGYYQGPYTAADATEGRFEAPLVPGDTATIELRVPAHAAATLELGTVGAGFRDAFGLAKAGAPGNPGASGACNVDVVCPLGDAYADEIRAVGFYEYRADDDRQYYLCSGTLLADVPRDGRNWFLTAAHCVHSATEAASVVVYWNYQSTRCGTLAAPPAGFFGDDQHGALLRATRSDADFSLLELTGAAEPEWNLYRAGWDASGAAPAATVGIHHPSGDVKKITAGPAPSTIASCIVDGAVAATHWRTGPYTQGTTEGGSSGSGLFAAAGASGARRLIGTLSGGDAACSSAAPTRPNAGTDCYGQFAVAWNGRDAASRLRDWLDPMGTGTLAIDGGDGQAAPGFPPPPRAQRPPPSILLQLPRQR